MTKNKAYTLLSTFGSTNFHLHHVNSHQDDTIVYEDLNLSAKLNNQADKISTTNTSKQISTYLITSPFVIYIANKSIRYSIDRKICYVSYSNQAKIFLATKHNWTMQKMSQINWEDHSNSIRIISHSKKEIRSMIHSLSPSNWKNTIFQ